MLSPDCLAAHSEDEWWACASTHFAYKYIKSNIFVVHTQYDKNQIFEGNGAPTSPANDTELDTVKRYVQMWGEATRQSLQQIIVDDDVSSFPKTHEDGVFSASCITHGTPQSVTIDGLGSMEIIGDWFFERGQLREHYKLIEECTPLEGNEDYVIPCNQSPVCAYKSSTNDDDGDGIMSMQKCAQQLMNLGCLQSFRPTMDCSTCARDNRGVLESSDSCSRALVISLCTFAEKNVIPSEGSFDGDAMGTNITLVDVGDDKDKDGADDNKVEEAGLDDTIDSGDGSSCGLLSKSAILVSTLSALLSMSCFNLFQ